jgi:hypothetical protein
MGGALTLYEDDGASRAHERGQFATTEIQSSFEGGSARINVGAVHGEYAGQAATRDITVSVWLRDRPSRVQVSRGGSTVDVAERSTEPSADQGSYWWYDGSPRVNVRVPQVDRSEAVNVHVSG